jgi:ATP/maltotriose-dependent transcriptional regulator MalT
VFVAARSVEEDTMLRPARIVRESHATHELVLIVCLTFVTWYLAELSNGILDSYAKASLLPAIGLLAIAIRLWSNLQRERVLREKAERMLNDSIVQSTVSAASTKVPESPAPARPLEALSDREREVLSLLASGCTNQRIADTLTISLNTVERHTANLYRKLEVRGRVEATHYAVRLGLVDEDSLDSCREPQG